MTEVVYRDPTAFRFIAFGYLPWLGGLNLVWEVAHVPLYGREPAFPRWRWGRVVVLTAILGSGYTVFSEWMNVTVGRSWSYAESMPRLDLGGFEIGLTPLAQWLVVPPLALYLASKTRTA